MGGRELQKEGDLVTEKDLGAETKVPIGRGQAAEVQRISGRQAEIKVAETRKTLHLLLSDAIHLTMTIRVNHWSDDDDEFEEPYEVAAVRHKDTHVTFSLQPQIYTHEVENIIIGRTKLLKKKSRARIGTQTPSKADSKESVREAGHRAKAMRAEVISDGEENDEYGAFSVQSRR
eukprot:1959528-Amphidinium_carterae.1